jgi:hypothetical protein
MPTAGLCCNDSFRGCGERYDGILEQRALLAALLRIQQRAKAPSP